MKAYVAYVTIAHKEIEIPDKFAELAKPDYSNELLNELDEYTNTPEFYQTCGPLDGDICAIENEDGERLIEW